MSTLCLRLAAIGLLLSTSIDVGRADDEVDALLARLFEGAPVEALTAAKSLRAMGARAREGLERRVDPAGAIDRATPPSAEEQAEIARLIDELGDARFMTREAATAALVAKGTAALPQLREASRGTDPERCARASQALQAIVPPARNDGPLLCFSRIQALLMLGWIGERDSVPALRHALDDPAPEVLAAADCALRMVLGGGPDGTPLEWRTRAAALRASWHAWIEAAVPPAGEAQTCRVAPLGEQGESLVTLRSRSTWRLDQSAFGGPVGPACEWTEGSEERYTSAYEEREGRGRWRRDYRGLRWAMTLDARAAGDALRPEVGEAEGQVLRFSPDGAHKAFDARWMETPRGQRPLLGPGEMVMEGAPTGERRPGELVALPDAAARRMGALLKRPLAGLFLPGMAIARVRYVGRSDGIDRLHLAVGWTGEFLGRHGGSRCEMVIQGPLAVDARTGLLVAYDLMGPGWGVSPGSPEGEAQPGSVHLGEQRFEAIVGAAPAPAAGSAELERALAPLVECDSAALAAARPVIRAAGEAIRPALEQVLRPARSDRAAEADVALAAYLGATDPAARVLAVVALTRDRAATHRAILDRLGTADMAIALELRSLVARVGPLESAAIEAALHLGAIGTADSIEPLRSALLAGSPAVAAAADHALRSIVGEGPPVSADVTRFDRAALIAAWDARLAAPPKRAGDPVTLAPLCGPGTAMASRLRYRIAVRMGASGIHWLPPGDNEITGEVEAHLARQTDARFRLEGRVAHFETRFAGPRGVQPPLVLADVPVAIVRSPIVGFELQAGGVTVPKSTPAVLPLAMLWGEHLPTGELAVGATRTIAGPFALRLWESLAVPPSYACTSVDGEGHLRYLGSTGGRDRFALSCRLAATVEGGIRARGALAGIVVVDPVRHLVVKTELVGPAWGTTGTGTAFGWIDIAEDELAGHGR